MPDGAFTSNLQLVKWVMNCIWINCLWRYPDFGTLPASYPQDLLFVGNKNRFAPFCRCYKTLKHGRNQHINLVYSVRTASGVYVERIQEIAALFW